VNRGAVAWVTAPQILDEVLGAGGADELDLERGAGPSPPGKDVVGERATGRGPGVLGVGPLPAAVNLSGR
jgi:hypothetical protein